MRLGYGLRVKESGGREYVDVWRYENRGGRRVQVFEYVGSLHDPATMDHAKVLLTKFQDQAMEEFRRRARRVGAVPGPS